MRRGVVRRGEGVGIGWAWDRQRMTCRECCGGREKSGVGNGGQDQRYRNSLRKLVIFIPVAAFSAAYNLVSPHRGGPQEVLLGHAELRKHRATLRLVTRFERLRALEVPLHLSFRDHSDLHSVDQQAPVGVKVEHSFERCHVSTSLNGNLAEQQVVRRHGPLPREDSQPPHPLSTDNSNLGVSAGVSAGGGPKCELRHESSTPSTPSFFFEPSEAHCFLSWDHRVAVNHGEEEAARTLQPHCQRRHVQQAQQTSLARPYRVCALCLHLEEEAEFFSALS
mmetsp:Transcript_25144/g.50452  ORF Transcript_25144/g.50452 Transcript_25144/m.50452 type:complete len:279 (+) Transcript_25144:698-1534(+)